MYSVVLMMALTSGGDMPAWGRGCCGGCYGGCYGCSGCYGCCGGHARKHGCCGGCFGCGGCHGCYGCCGGCYGGKHARKHGCCGCCGGCYGCAGCYGAGCLGACYGGGCLGTPVVPVTPPPAPPAKKTTLGTAPATLIVSVPADARLTIDGEATTSTAAQRLFVSPALNFGREYHYTLQAEYLKDGKMVKVSKEVAVKAGDETRVSFDAETEAAVASR